MKTICVSAMLQSQQTWLPVLNEPLRFANVIISRFTDTQKLIAHCVEGNKQQIGNQTNQQSALILIGPKGDFTNDEINLALESSFIPVTLGESRLRSETAGVVAAALLIHS